MELKIEAINPSPHPSVIGLTGEYLIIFINTLYVYSRYCSEIRCKCTAYYCDKDWALIEISIYYSQINYRESNLVMVQ